MLLLSATWSVFAREMLRLVRQKTRIVGFLAMPILFWLMLGFGVGERFKLAAAGGLPYQHWFFPGSLLMIVLFAAIFSTITVIEDRASGFLQGVLVSPAPRLAIALGKCLGGTVSAVLQAGLVLLVAPLLGIHYPPLAGLAALGILALVAFGLTAVGLCMAWPMDSAAGYHGLMNLILMPMWFLSGAVFPAVGAPGVLKWAMLANPACWAHSALARVLLGQEAADATPLSVGLGLGLFAAFSLLVLAAATTLANRPWRGK